MASVACHPEMAGHGIEYCWGYGETMLRKINDHTDANLHANVKRALSPECLSLQRIWKFERRARDYMRMYEELERKFAQDPALKSKVNHQMLENSRKDLRFKDSSDCGFLP